MLTINAYDSGNASADEILAQSRYLAQLTRCNVKVNVCGIEMTIPPYALSAVIKQQYKQLKDHICNM
jgi:hypothetical protein